MEPLDFSAGLWFSPYEGAEGTVFKFIPLSCGDLVRQREKTNTAPCLTGCPVMLALSVPRPLVESELEVSGGDLPLAG